MAIPKHKPQEPDQEEETVAPLIPEDADNRELQAEMKALEEASIEDLTDWEQSLSSE